MKTSSQLWMDWKAKKLCESYISLMVLYGVVQALLVIFLLFFEKIFG